MPKSVTKSAPKLASKSASKSAPKRSKAEIIQADPVTESTAESTAAGSGVARFAMDQRYDALNEFKRIFGLPTLPIDTLCSFFCGHINIDILKFEELLKQKHPDVDWDSTSIRTVVQKYYGEEGSQFITRLL
jgi:hypothetical protein